MTELFCLNQMRIHEKPTAVSGTNTHYNEKRDKWQTKELLEVTMATTQTHFLTPSLRLLFLL